MLGDQSALLVISQHSVSNLYPVKATVLVSAAAVLIADDVIFCITILLQSNIMILRLRKWSRQLRNV